jgi:Arc/MetJ family transcription regulator
VIGVESLFNSVCWSSSPKSSPIGDKIGEEEHAGMRATVTLDDELVKTAEELSGLTERTALLREALKVFIHFNSSRRLAALGGTMPDLEYVRRTRVDDL